MNDFANMSSEDKGNCAEERVSCSGGDSSCTESEALNEGDGLKLKRKWKVSKWLSSSKVATRGSSSRLTHNNSSKLAESDLSCETTSDPSQLIGVVSDHSQSSCDPDDVPHLYLSDAGEDESAEGKDAERCLDWLVTARRSTHTLPLILCEDTVTDKNDDDGDEADIGIEKQSSRASTLRRFHQWKALHMGNKRKAKAPKNSEISSQKQNLSSGGQREQGPDIRGDQLDSGVGDRRSTNCSEARSGVLAPSFEVSGDSVDYLSPTRLPDSSTRSLTSDLSTTPAVEASFDIAGDEGPIKLSACRNGEVGPLEVELMLQFAQTLQNDKQSFNMFTRNADLPLESMLQPQQTRLAAGSPSPSWADLETASDWISHTKDVCKNPFDMDDETTPAEESHLSYDSSPPFSTSPSCYTEICGGVAQPTSTTSTCVSASSYSSSKPFSHILRFRSAKSRFRKKSLSLQCGGTDSCAVGGSAKNLY